MGWMGDYLHKSACKCVGAIFSIALTIWIFGIGKIPYLEECWEKLDNSVFLTVIFAFGISFITIPLLFIFSRICWWMLGKE